MKKKKLSKIYIFIALVTVLILSIPALASHIFQSDTDIITDGSDTWTEANDTESLTVTVNVTGDYLNQTNITVPCNSSGYANYSINWSTLVPSHTNWTCTNETDASENVSKIICQTTPGNETNYLQITFDATAFDLNDSFHNWTVVTMDNASATNTTDMTTSIGISPYVFNPMPANKSWTNGTMVFSVNVTDNNLNVSGVFRHWRLSTGFIWPSTSDYHNKMNCINYSAYDYYCNHTQDFSGLGNMDIYYYFYAYDNYTGYGSNGSTSNYFILHVDAVPPLIIVNSPLNNIWYNNILDINLTVNDSNSGIHTVSYNMSNTTWSNITYLINSSTDIYNTTLNTSEYTSGINYTLYFYANDSVSNEANTSITVRFDNSPPSKASLEYPNAGMIIAGDINLSTLVRDDGSGIQNVSFYSINETWADDGNGTWDPTENITGINWTTFIGTNASGNSTAGYDHNWTFRWDTTSFFEDGDYYLAINVTDNVYNSSNYNESATLEIAAQNGNGSNSSGGIFVQVRNTDPIITFYSPQNSSNSTPLEGLVDVNFSITSITGINLSTIELIITNATLAEYTLYDSLQNEFDPASYCGSTSFKNDSYFNMTFYGYNCLIPWHTLKSGENGTTLDDQNLTLTASGYSNDIDNDTMKVPSKDIFEYWEVNINNTGVGPSIFLLQPLNPYFSSGQPVDFSFYVLDNEDTNMTCDLYVDDVFHNRNASVYNGNSTHNITVLSSNGAITGSGRHMYRINCTDQKSNPGEYESSIIIDPEKINYVILLPSDYSNYSNSQFNSIGQSINATINNNSLIYTAFIDTPHYYSIPERATILYFDDSSFGVVSSVSGNIKAFDGEHVTIVLHPQYVTPNLIRKFNNLFKNLNDDPYIDVSWGILTGKLSSSAGSLADRSLGIAALNQTTHHNYYEPESLVFTRSSAFAPLEQAYQAAATFIRNALSAAGAGSLYAGSAASNINLFNRLDNFDDSNIIYFAGGGRNDKLYRNSSDTSDIFNDYNICPFINTLETTIECRDTGIFTSFKNRLVFFSTSDYFARISSNDTNVSSWDLNNGADEDWISDESLIVQMLHNSPSENGPVAFIGHTSVTWVTSEHLAKIFFLRLLEGMDIGSALSSAKNAAILNSENIQDTTAKDFLSHLESSLVLYGIPQTESHNEIGYIDYTAQNLVQVDANPSTGEDIQWNSTILISPKSDITPLYSGGLWRSTHGNVWYYNVTEPYMPVSYSGKINITFVASLAGEYIPDSTAYNLNVSSDDVNSVNLTLMTVEVERTEISPSSSSEQYNQSTAYINATQTTDDDLKYAVKSNKSLIFAILYSPNSTLLSSCSKAVNLTFVTEGVSIETISVSGSGTGSGQAENNITAVFNLINPTEKTISNLTIKYPIPSLVLSCAVSGSYVTGSCINTAGYAKQNISQVFPGKTQYTLSYIADADMVNSTSVYYDYGGLWTNEYVFNWGDNVTIKSNINVSSLTNTDIFTEIILLKNTGNQYVDPVQENAIVWSDKTTIQLGSAKTMIDPVWEVPVNTSESQPGEYLIKTYVLENETSKYLLKNIIYVNLTDEINLSITDTDISSDTVEGYLPQGKFNFSFTGSAKKQTGQLLNGTAIGQPSIYVYLNSGDTPLGNDNITVFGQFENITIKDIDPGIGSHTLRIRVFDESNNSKEELYPINVTNYAETLTVTTNTSGTANEEDWIKISGTIYGNGTLKVYNADVTVRIDGETICILKSSTSGTYSCDWQVPYGEDDKTYNINVSAISPLDTSKTISNTTQLKVVWLNVTIDPTLPDIGVTSSTGFSKTVTVEGLIRYNWDMTNISIVEGAAVECFIKDTGGWNDTVTADMGVFVNYSCEFSEGINHTGTYEVTVSATHDDIDSRAVRGYISQKFKIIDTTPDDDGPSDGVSPGGALPPSGNRSTETTANLNFSYFKTVEIEQGLSKKITITILNNGEETLHNLTINLSGVNWTDWYVVTNPEILSMPAGAWEVFSINISVPQDAEVSNHTIEAKVTASETHIDDAITFTISVLPSNKSIEETRVELIEIGDVLSEYNDRLKNLFIEFSDPGMLQKLFRPLNGTRIAEAKEKLIEANDLMEKARELLEAGDTIEAFKAKRQADLLIAEVEKVIEEEEQKLFYVSKLLNILKIIAVSMLAVSMLVGYMLLPPSKGKYMPKDEFFQKVINTKSYLNGFSQKLSEQFSKIRNKIDGKSGRKEEGPSGIKKIDLLHQKFENYHKKDD